MKAWAHGAFGALLMIGLTAAGCARNSEGSSGGGGAGGTGTSGAAGSTGTGGCANAEDCPAGQVCDPAAHACVSDLPCSAHADCGGAAYCSGGKCAPSVPGGPCDDDTACVTGEHCTKGFCGCGGEIYGAETVPPNVLIALDRSDSMNDPIPGGTKWSVAKQAINDLVSAYGSSVYFGLLLYPGYDLSGTKGNLCGSGTAFVAPGPMTTGAILQDLGAAGTTMFGTPTAEALSPLMDLDAFKDSTRGNYILLLTDGKSTCNDPVPVVATLFGKTPKVTTFAVGFGDAVDPNELSALAQAGGAAKPQVPYYYKADDAPSLGAAFASIAGSVLSCAYALSKTPPDQDELYVYVDSKPVTQNAVDGWTYDPVTNQITFTGATCEALKSGAATEVLISYGCPIAQPD